MTGEYVAAIDQGTTGTRSVVVDEAGRIVADAYARHEQYYPRPGWVEHDLTTLLENVRGTLRAAVEEAAIHPNRLVAVGLTNQRETTACWDAETGEPLARAIVWQDRRTTDRVEALTADPIADRIRDRTGLEPDAYFSATKMEWLLDAVDGAPRGSVRLGTIDAWLLDRLTGAHVTDVTNASRTMLFDIHQLDWDDTLLERFDVPGGSLPEVRPSIPATPFGTLDIDGTAVPVTAVLGDQQAALFGQTCFEAGQAKATLGTGAFLLQHTGSEPAGSEHGLLTTIAYQWADRPVQYALEGSVFVAGAAVEWLESVGVLTDAAESEAVAAGSDRTEELVVVPALAGLGAPQWDGRARGTVLGIGRDTTRAQLVRATLEGIANRIRDVTDAMTADSGVEPSAIRLDGGAADNAVLCQSIADLLGFPVERSATRETTALGAATAAGLGAGLWTSLEELKERVRPDRRFDPSLDRPDVRRRRDRWQRAVDLASGWAEDGGSR